VDRFVGVPDAFQLSFPLTLCVCEGVLVFTAAIHGRDSCIPNTCVVDGRRRSVWNMVMCGGVGSRKTAELSLVFLRFGSFVDRGGAYLEICSV